MSGKELFEFQMALLKIYDETMTYVQNNHELSKAAVKHINVVREYLALYEIMQDSLDRVEEACERIMDLEEVEAVEELLKRLKDKFWYE